MTKQTTTPLGYLMDMLYIQGTQLAKMVHVDRTVISRWKNGRSELNMKSGYFDDVVNALLDINEEQGLQTLERFFTSMTRKNIQKRKDLQKQVATWLVSRDFDRRYKEQDSGNSLYNATYKIYKGTSGKKDALNYFWDVLLSLPSGETAWGYDTNSNIFIPTAKDVRANGEKIAKAQEKGDDIITLLYLNRPADEIFSMYLHFLPIFMSEHSRTYYTYNVNTSFYDYIYSIKGKMALIGSNHDNDRNNQYTAVYDDPMTLRQLDTFLEKQVASFQPLFKHLDVKDVSMDFREEEIVKHLNNSMDQYTVMEEVPFLYFTQPTMDAIIQELDLSFAEERKIQAFYKTSNIQSRKFFADDKFSRIILSYDMIEQLGKKETVEVPFLSLLMGKRVEIRSKHLLREFLSFIDSVADSPSVEVAMRPKSSAAFIPNLNLWAKKNSVLYLYPTGDASTRLLTDEFITVTAFYSMLDEYWTQLPAICKNLGWIREELDSLI